MAVCYLFTTATGSHAWTDTTIWVGGSVPVTGDVVTLLSAPSAFKIDTGLAQIAVTLASLTISNAFAGSVGGLGNAPLAIGMTNGYIGAPPPDGSIGAGVGSVKIDTGTNAVNWTIYNSASQGPESPLPTICLRGVNVSSVINVLGGVVGVGTLVPGEASTFATINATGGRVEVGSGVAYTTAVNDGGVMILNAGASATVSNLAGTLRTSGVYLMTSLTSNDVTQVGHRAASGNSITTFTINSGNADFSFNPALITIGTSNINGGTLIQFKAAQISFGTLNLVVAKSTFAIQPQS